MNLDKILSRHKCYGENCFDVVPFKFCCREKGYYTLLLPMSFGSELP